MQHTKSSHDLRIHLVSGSDGGHRSSIVAQQMRDVCEWHDGSVRIENNTHSDFTGKND